jgi:hypothetical protein
MKITMTMKADFLSRTKMLYLAEWLAQGSHYLLPEPDALARQTGFTEQEIREMYDQFEHEGIFRWEDISVESENNYGELKSEISYDGLVADMGKLIVYIDDTKKRLRLRKEPAITREAIASIAEQLQTFFGKEKLIKIINSFSGDSDMTSGCFDNDQCSLTDILFWHSYADSSIQPLSMVLAKFLNPIYYNIDDSDRAVKVFDYIDRILSMANDRHDYEEWIKAAEKYIKIPKNDSKELNHGAISKEIRPSSYERERENEASRLITKSTDDGDYLFKGKRISASKATLGHNVFDILFSHGDQEGFLSYQSIDDYLVKWGHPQIDDEGKRAKRIQNAISNKQQGFFRHAKIGGNGMKNKTPDGKRIVEVVRGRGLKFNNTILK